MGRRISQAYSKLIGVPYEEKNCWAIVREFYLIVLGVELKSYFDGDSTPPPSDVRSLIYTNIGDFEKIDGAPLLGDIILMKLRGIESHIGVFLGENKLLHSVEGIGCHIDRVDRWHNMISGYYRIKERVT